MKFINQKYVSNKDKLNNQFKSAKPFPYLVLNDFFITLDKVKKELLKEKFTAYNSDLFQFSQTVDMQNTKNKTLKEFHGFFSSKVFIKFVSEITGKKLNSIDMSGFIYRDTDYLLPHDDRLEGRKIAYIINFSDLSAKDGGKLQLFKNKKVVKSIVPKFNSFVIFEVSKDSLHQVEEIKSNKNRITLAGWFHAN